MSAVDYRRALHRIPELDNQLPETVQLVQRILAPLPCRVFSPITGSVCAWFDAGKSDAVAFRAELDALPVTEATDLPYASVHPGRMHACGHDAHTAMVLTLAEYAAEHLAELPRNHIRLHFDESLSTALLAEELQCSADYLNRLCRRSWGCTVTEEINRVRLAHACRLLLAGKLNVKEVAYESGFNDLAYFRRRFRALYGQTPAEYRKAHSLGHVNTE